MEDKINSKEFLKPKFRQPFQTTGFIYKALDIAEQQIVELLEKTDKLEKENRRLKSLAKVGISNIREKRKK